ncbi:MAG: hypothetical protein KDE09_17890 [Anaerolineales bacterium]|nr:hypothetical protein [Anaerolineales bacterium]
MANRLGQPLPSGEKVSTAASTSPIPNLTTVAEIAALADPVTRNAQITRCYHELSALLAVRTGPGANWCTFATWASKQAGQTIRQEDFAAWLQEQLGLRSLPLPALTELLTLVQLLGSSHPMPILVAAIWRLLDPPAAARRASEAVARVNQKVFTEIGYEFARFYDVCLADTGFDAENINRFCRELKAGEPPDGQAYLARAFAAYYQALFEPDPSRRAQLLFFANISIGFHEQTRLQPEILAALEAAVLEPAAFRRELLKALFPWRGWLIRFKLLLLALFRGPSPLDVALNNLLTWIKRDARLLITEHMMRIGLADGRFVRLGRDLPATFPPSLRQISLPELHTLLAEIDPTPDDLSGSGAVDWGNLPDRLHFIADFFRAYQEEPLLFAAPEP